jgi:predicted transposase/invertase (TIGR01784 family)
MSKKRYKLTNDLLFKAVFGRDEESSKQLLMHLLNALLERKGTEKITAIEHKNPFSIREKEDEKEVIFDIKVRLMNGQYVDIEMQVRYIEKEVFFIGVNSTANKKCVVMIMWKCIKVFVSIL